LVAGVESFTGHHQKQWHRLTEPERQAWLALVISFAIFGHLGCSTTSAPQVPRQHPLPYDSRYHAGLSTWRTLPWTPFWPRRLGRLS
jgi:hypothetical protein